MATDLQDPPIGETEKKPGLFASKKVKVLGLLLIVMIAEGVGMYFFFGGSKAGANADDSEEPAEVVTVEVEIGSFNFTNSRAAAGETRSISFKLFVVVAQDQSTNFEQLANREHQARIRALIQETVLKAALEELNDPTHRVIKRNIKDGINRELRKSFVHKVLLNGFNQTVL